MAKKKNSDRRGNPESTAYNPKSNEPRADKPETHEAKPSFEIGVKGDEFGAQIPPRGDEIICTGRQAFEQP